jgi:anti-sigma regulatory factor (Ser/Thr protein kinase)
MQVQTVPEQYRIILSDPSQIGEARRVAARAAQRAALNETACGKVAIVATELATNALRHARGGEMLVQTTDGGLPAAVEVIAIDRGPGMADPSRCMDDGYSTAGSLGQGLGAIRRLSTIMEVYSAPSRGTAVYARIEADEHSANPPRPSPWCAISVPAPGETQCGDSWRLARSQEMLSAAMADGLGHGPLAALAANTTMAAFEREPFAAPGRYLAAAHEAARTTRGAALACVQIDLRRKTLLYAGIGNIRAGVVSHTTQTEKALPSHNGTVGLQLGRVQQFQYAAEPGDLLLMHSDGLSGRWKLGDYPGLSHRAPALIAAVLYRDFKRGQDDATILVLRLR